MTVLSIFLEFPLNFPSNDVKNTKKIGYSQREKRCQSLNCQKHSLKGQSATKSPVKPTWRGKMTVSSTFLEFPLNFPSNNVINITKPGTLREKNDVKI